MSELQPIDKFDELSAIIRFLLYIKRHPRTSIRKITSGTPAGSRAIESARKFAKDHDLVVVTMKETFPYGPQYSLSEKGKKVAEHLEEIQRVLNS